MVLDLILGQCVNKNVKLLKISGLYDLNKAGQYTNESKMFNLTYLSIEKEMFKYKVNTLQLNLCFFRSLDFRVQKNFKMKCVLVRTIL